MKNHLKTLASPKTWMVDRKDKKYIIKPKPGPQPLDYSLALSVVLRDLLKKANTVRETKKILNAKQVLVDGKIRKDYRLPVGLFDVISFPKIKEHYRILFDFKGRITIKKIDQKESTIKPHKIVGKTMLAKHLQLNFQDGKNILVKKDFKCKVGDTLILDFNDKKKADLIELKKDAAIYVMRGKRSGESGILKEINGNEVTYVKNKKEIQTLKKYLFVIGDKKPIIDVNLE